MSVSEKSCFHSSLIEYIFTYLGVNQLRGKYRIISACHRHFLQTKSDRNRIITSQRIRTRSYGRQRQNFESRDNVRPSTAHLILTFNSFLLYYLSKFSPCAHAIG